MRRRYEKGQLVWVAPGSVRYDREDIDFLLPWLKEMREGAYPAEPTGYVEGKRVGVLNHAFYEAACQVAAEIDIRLRRCQLDRYIVEDYYCNDWQGSTDEEILHNIAGKLDMEVWEISRRIKSALSYISSGACPRWLNCVDCPRYQSCRRKKRVGVSYRDWVRSRSRYHLTGKVR